MNLNENIGKIIKEARVEAGISQNDLADLCFISRSKLAKIELGERMPNIHDLRALCTHLMISADYLLGISLSPRRESVADFVTEFIKNEPNMSEKILIEINDMGLSSETTVNMRIGAYRGVNRILEFLCEAAVIDNG